MKMTLLCLRLALLVSLTAGFIPAEGNDGPAAIAYLFDSMGDVSVVRAGSTNRVTSSCITLNAQDAVVLGAGAVARVVFPSSVYELVNAGVYSIQAPSVMVLKSEPGEQRDLVALRGSGNPLLDTDEMDLVLPPADLFAYVKPPIYRAGEDQGVVVLSPVGYVWSTTPVLEWTGCSNATYEISVSVAGEGNSSGSRFPWFETKGGSVSWFETGWPSLERGALYTINIRQNGQPVAGQNAYFFILDQNHASKLEEAIEKIPKGVSVHASRLFMEASLLLNPDWGCAAEARIKARQLVLLEPENPAYLSLLKRCYTQLGLAKQAAMVQGEIERQQKESRL